MLGNHNLIFNRFVERTSMITLREQIQKCAYKLKAQGMTKENYTKERAVAVLNECVAAGYLIDLLSKYEFRIREYL